MSTHPEDRPVDLAGVPEEEDMSTADAADRLDESPEDQPNHPEQHPQAGRILPPD